MLERIIGPKPDPTIFSIILDFLTLPYSTLSANKVLSYRVKSEVNWADVVWLGSITDGRPSRTAPSRAIIQAMLQSAHVSFQTSDIRIQGIALAQLIRMQVIAEHPKDSPPLNQSELHQAIILRGIELVIGSRVDESTTAGSDGEVNVREALRTGLLAFGENLGSERTQQIFWGSLVAAVSRVMADKGLQHEADVHKQLGQIIQEFLLGLEGPAEIRLLQQLQQIVTDTSFREGIGTDVTHSVILDRWWDMMRRIEELTEASPPDSRLRTVTTIYPPLGGATYRYGHLAEFQDGTTEVLRYTRADAPAIAKVGFERLERALISWVDKYPVIAPYVAVVLELVRQGAEDLKSEFDPGATSQRFRDSISSLNGALIIDLKAGIRTTVKVCAPTEIGMFYEIMDRAHGTPLQSVSPGQRRFAAQSYLTVRFHELLSGGPFNNDGHSGQTLFEMTTENDATHSLIDPNGVQLQPFSDQQKEAVANHVLLPLFRACAVDQGDIASVLRGMGAQPLPVGTDEAIIKAVRTMRKAVTAIADTVQLLEPIDVFHALVAVYKAGGIDGIYLQAFAGEIGREVKAMIEARREELPVDAASAESLAALLTTAVQCPITFLPPRQGAASQQTEEQVPREIQID